MGDLHYSFSANEWQQNQDQIGGLLVEIKRLQRELRIKVQIVDEQHDEMSDKDDEIEWLQVQRSSDLKIIDELLCHIKGSKAWVDMQSGCLTDGCMATRDAMVRLEQAWTQGEMEICTMSLVNYFDARRDVQVSIEAAEEK